MSKKVRTFASTKVKKVFFEILIQQKKGFLNPLIFKPFLYKNNLNITEIKNKINNIKGIFLNVLEL